MLPHTARVRHLLAGLLALLCLTPAGAHAGTVLSTAGVDPAVAVDSAGTGHFAWFTKTGSAYPYTYYITYCRLPRGASACAATRNLALPGTVPGNADHFGTAAVLLSGSKVILLATVLGGSAGADGIWGWISSDGGSTFAAGKQVGPSLNINAARLGPGSNAISTISSVETGGASYGYSSLAGGAGAKFKIGANLFPDGDDADGDSDLGLLSGTQPYAVMETDHGVVVRQWKTGTVGYTTDANWTPAQLVSDSNVSIVPDPQTAYGPNGAFIGYDTNDYVHSGYPYAIRRLNDDGTIGPITYISRQGANPNDADMTEDDSGRVYVAYQDNHEDNRLYYQWSKRGVTWSEPIPLSGVGEEDGNSSQIAAAPDGGGWVVAQHVPTDYGQILAFPFAPKGAAEDPNWDPNATPGANPTPPPAPADACPADVTVATGILAKVRSGDCFKDVSKTVGSKSTPAGTIFQTSGSVRVNGIDFTAPPSGTFTVNTKSHTVDAKGAYKIQAGSIVLATGSRTWDVTQVNTVSGLSAFGVKLFGLAVTGKADVTFDSKGAGITINVDLPYPVDAVHGQTTLRTTMHDGLVVDGILITADTVPIGPLELRNLKIQYTGESDSFEGHAEVYLPPAAKSAITAGFGLSGGDFKHAEFEVGAGIPPLPLPLFATPPIVLNRVGFAASVDSKGFKLGGGVQIVLGTQIAGMTPLAIDALPSSGGGASLFIPKNGAYAEISASGKLTVLDLPIATGSVDIRTDGPVTFSGGTDLDFVIVDVGIHYAGGLNLSNGDFYAQGDGGACVDFIDVAGCAKVAAILSSIGIAGCGELSLKEKLTGFSVSVGLGLDRPWGGSVHLGGCNLDAYKPASLGGPGGPPPPSGPAPTTVALDGPSTISLPGGDDVRGVRVTGTTGRPGFIFTNLASGRSITVPSNLKEAMSSKKIVAIPVDNNAVELQVFDPKGTWTITPDATQSQLRRQSADNPVARRTATVASVQTAAQLPTPKLSGSVRTLAGRSRQLTVRASNLGDQTLMLREILPGGAAHELGKVKRNGTVSVRFTPADGPAGKRDIQAVVITKDGRQVGTPKITSYRAPGPIKLAAPRRVTLARKSLALGVRWTKVAGAARYRVIVTATDGRQQIITVDGKSTKTQIPFVTADDKVTVKVAGVDQLGKQGATRAATSQARKTKKKSSKKR